MVPAALSEGTLSPLPLLHQQTVPMAPPSSLALQLPLVDRHARRRVHSLEFVPSSPSCRRAHDLADVNATAADAVDTDIPSSDLWSSGSESDECSDDGDVSPMSCNGGPAPASSHLARCLTHRGGYLFDIRDFGARSGDGVCTDAIRKTVEAVQKRGRGVVYIPEGEWKSVPFHLTSHCTLFVENGATLRATDDLEDFPPIPPLPSYGQGRDHPGPRHMSFIQVDNMEDVVITGNNGVIDGSGQKWWQRRITKAERVTRGHLVEFLSCRNVTLSYLTLQSSPHWTVHPVYCDTVHLHHLTILSPHYHAPNTDGINPDSSANVVIEYNHISTGDDAIAIKSGWDHHGYRFARPCRNIVIRHNYLSSTRCAGICVGSEMSGGISNVLIYDNKIVKCCQGIHFKTAMGRGGYVRNVTLMNCTMEDVQVAVRLNGYYRGHPHDGYDTTAVPDISDLHFKRLRVTNALQVLEAQGLSAAPFTKVRLEDVQVRLDPDSSKPAYSCEHVSGTAKNVYPEPPETHFKHLHTNIVEKNNIYGSNGDGCLFGFLMNLSVLKLNMRSRDVTSRRQVLPRLHPHPANRRKRVRDAQKTDSPSSSPHNGSMAASESVYGPPPIANANFDVAKIQRGEESEEAA
mmetsp:Transcript_13920/g.33119  ORF Transcript_13920/g.33119 Transcript_13920/m.33119 type:complete len:630 (+) Transcript_13920:71-1960(+)